MKIIEKLKLLDFPQAVLGVSAVMFFSFGVASLVCPEWVVGLAHIETPHPSAKTEVRAFYGGLEIGLALFLLHCIVRRRHLVSGLWLATLILGGVVTGRLIGAAVDGVSGFFVYGALMIEGPLFGFTLAALIRALAAEKKKA